MNTQTARQNWKSELQKLIRRLAEKKSINQTTYVSPQSDEIRRIRERNQYLRDETPHVN